MHVRLIAGVAYIAPAYVGRPPVVAGGPLSPCVTMSAPSEDFRRASDILQLGGSPVTARQIVNVLGRWEASDDWDSIGRTGKMDDFSSGDYYDDDLPSFSTNFSAGAAFYMARRPQRREFCKTYGLVQRWAHGENVAMLPFTDAALAASVGATVEELNAEPVDPLAAEIVPHAGR